jgi:hypothetical protein
MINVEPEPAKPDPRSGVSMLEALVVMSLFSFLTAAAFQALSSTKDASDCFDGVSRVEVRSQTVLDRISNEAAASVRLYGDDADGQAVISMLEGVPGEMLPNSKLPMVLDQGIIEKDQGTIDTGNCLVFLKAEPPFMLKSATTNEDVLRVDLYRFIAIYLTNGESGPPLDRPDGLDLVLFRSELIANLSEVREVSNPFRRMRLLLTLRNDRGVRFLIDPRKPINDAFAEIDAFGEIDDNPSTPFDIKANPVKGRTSLFPQHHFSVATNASGTKYGVGRLTPRVNTGSGFPHGFEIRVVGTAKSRQVFAHLTVVLRKGDERYYADLDAAIIARDF